MPELTPEACHKFWFEYNDPTLYKSIAFLESAEDWTIEQDERIVELLQQMGTALDKMKESSAAKEFNDLDLVINASVQLKSSQILRILQAIDTAIPGTASKILTHGIQQF